MPGKESDEDVKARVNGYGDTFIANVYDINKKRYFIEFICGVCKVETKRVKDKFKGHCAECCKKSKSTEKPAENKHYFQVIQSIGYTLLYEEEETIIPTKTKLTIQCDCGEKMEKTYRAFRNSNSCKGCKKEHVKLDNIKNIKTTKKEEPKERTEDEIELPEGYTLRSVSKKNFVYLCDSNHANRGKYDSEIVCAVCELGSQSELQRKSDESIIKLLADRDFKLTSVYTNDKNLIEIQCTKCETYNYKTMGNLISKNMKCEKCQDVDAQPKKLEMKTKLFQKFCKELEEENYKMTSTDVQYVDNTTKFKVTCPQNHTFETNQCNFTISKRRCKQCDLIKKSEKNRLSDEDVNITLDKRSLKLNGNYVNAKTPIDLICKQCDNHFSICLNNIKWNKTGCPSCNASVGETAIIEVLKTNNVNYVKEYKFQKPKQCKDTRDLPFDFYLPDLNLIIEFDGIQHSKPIGIFGGPEGYELTRKHDVIKTFHCIKNKIPILRISHQDIENVSEILLPIINNIELEENDYSEVNYVIYSNPVNYTSLIVDLKKYMEFNS